MSGMLYAMLPYCMHVHHALLCMLCILIPFDTREHFKSIWACRFAILGPVDEVDDMSLM